MTKTGVFMLALYFPLSLICLFLSSFHPLGIIALGVALFSAAVGCVLYFYLPVSRFKQTPKFREEYYLAFSRDGISFKTASVCSELKWDVYSEMWESDAFYFLIQAPKTYALIPKRAFCGPEARRAFEELASSNLRRVKSI